MKRLEAFQHGLYLAITGLFRARRQPAVRSTYLLLLALILVVSFVLDAAGLYAIYRFLPWNSDTLFVRVTAYLLAPIFGLVVLLVSPLIAITLSTLLFPPLAERPFFGVLRRLRPNQARLLEAQSELAWVKSVAHTLRRLATLLFGSSVTMGVSTIPFVGPILALGLHLYLLSWLTTWELLDPYFSRANMSYEQQRAFLHAHLPEVLGFGLPLGLLLSVPVLGPMLFPLAQGAAAELLAATTEDVS